MVDTEPPGSAGAMSPDPSAVRVGNTERNAAVNALGEHLSTGRLDLDEFGTRSAKASSARNVGEPGAVQRPAGAASAAPGGRPDDPARAARDGNLAPVSGATPALVDDRSKAQKLVAAAAGAAGILALVLFFATNTWWWFLLIPLISSIAGGIWGESWKRPDRRR